MAEPTMATLSARLSSELSRSEEEVVLSFTRRGNNFMLQAHAIVKDDNGDWMEVDFDFLQFIEGQGLYLYPEIWNKLGFPTGANAKLKVIDEKKQELALVPIKDLVTIEEALERDKSVGVKMDGKTYVLEKSGESLLLKVEGHHSNNIITLSKSRGIIRHPSVNRDIGLPLDEEGKVKFY